MLFLVKYYERLIKHFSTDFGNFNYTSIFRIKFNPFISEVYLNEEWHYSQISPLRILLSSMIDKEFTRIPDKDIENRLVLEELER